MAPKKAPASSSSTAAANDDPTSVNPDGMSSSRTTHSREKLKLCEQIVLNHFGPVASQIASLLLQRGRLSLKELERFLVSAVGVHEETNVTKAQILHTLLVLVQHNVLFHIRLNGDGGIIDDIDEPGGTEHFEINPEAILVRARFGTYIEQAQRLWGDEGMHITRLILENGKIQVSDLLAQMPSTSSATRPLITQMLLSAYILPSTVISHISPHDVRIAYTNEARKKFKGIPGPKDLKAIDEAVKDRIARERNQTKGVGIRNRDERDVGQAWCGSAVSANGSKSKRSNSTKKRKLAVDTDSDHDQDSDDDHKSKKRGKDKTKKSSAQPEMPTSPPTEWMKSLTEAQKARLDSVIVTDSTYVRLNYDRFDVHIRNEVLFDLISSMYNPTMAWVYMEIVESADVRKTDQENWPSVSDRQSELVSLTLLSSALPSSASQIKKEIDGNLVKRINRGFDEKMFKVLMSKSGASKASTYDYVAEYVALLSRAEDITARSGSTGNVGAGGEAAIATSATRYLIPGTTNSDVTTVTGSKISSSCSVDFCSAGRKLKWNLLKQTVLGVFGETEARILGVLRREGKLEEKHISKLALLSYPDAREGCERLFARSIIALQEVPKSIMRDPTRTFYLYYLDYPKALAWLSDHLHRTQARLIQRRDAEREKFRTLLNKAERTDVKSDGVDKVLSKVENMRLNDCKERLRLLTVAEGRVERQSWILARMPM